MKTADSGSLHLFSATLLIFYFLLLLERGAVTWPFLAWALLAFLAAFSKAALLRSKPVSIILVFIESVLMFFIAFKLFVVSFHYIPWMFIVAGSIFGLSGLNMLGIKIKS